MFRLQHLFNNIVETTQLTNDQMPEFHRHCKCSKCSPPAPSYNTGLVDRSLLQITPHNLKRFLEFGACFRICFKLAVSLQHCTPYVIVHWVNIFGEFGGHWSFVIISGQPARIRFCALRGVARCVRADAPSCWKMNPNSPNSPKPPELLVTQVSTGKSHI